MQLSKSCVYVRVYMCINICHAWMSSNCELGLEIYNLKLLSTSSLSTIIKNLYVPCSYSGSNVQTMHNGKCNPYTKHMRQK